MGAAMSAIARRFEEIVRLYPEREAVKSGNRTLSYRELDQQANELAHRLRQQLGTGGGCAGLLLEHGVDLAAGAMACLKAGCMHVPLDLNNPPNRQADILEDAQACVVVRMRSTPGLGVDGIREVVVDDRALDPLPIAGTGSRTSPEIAFLLYTSGSTGRPKGVIYQHDDIVARIADYNRFAVGPGDRITALGAGGMNMYRALLTGATLVALNLREFDVDDLPRWLADEGITIYHSVPTVLRGVLRGMLSGSACRLELPSLRLVNITGETLLSTDVEQFRRCFPHSCVLVNGLGTTEAGTFREHRIDRETLVAEGVVPAGHAIEGLDVMLLDHAGHPVTQGAIGEIVVTGKHLSAGYWRQPDLTAERFFVDVHDPARRGYRTGDLGRLLPDGSLMHLGREDFQVKIRGHRVDVGEVEVTCRKLPLVRDVAVVGRPDSRGVLRLYAFLVLEPGASMDLASLLAFLRDRLPEYMVPSGIRFLEKLPVTPNGKVDRLALPELPDADPESFDPSEVTSASGDLEAVLQAIWQEVLQVRTISVDDDFFGLGGDSLSAARIASRVYSALAIDLPGSAVFKAPTIRELSLRIDALRQSGTATAP